MPGLRQIARQAAIRDTQAQAVFEAIQALVVSGERVVIRNFGVFYLYESKSRTVRSPLIEGGKRTIPGYRRIKFKPSKHMRLTVRKDLEHGLSKVVGKAKRSKRG